MNIGFYALKRVIFSCWYNLSGSSMNYKIDAI